MRRAQRQPQRAAVPPSRGAAAAACRSPHATTRHAHARTHSHLTRDHPMHPVCTHLYHLRLPCFDPPAAASSTLARFDCTAVGCGVPPLPISAAPPCLPRVNDPQRLFDPPQCPYAQIRSLSHALIACPASHAYMPASIPILFRHRICPTRIGAALPSSLLPSSADARAATVASH